MVDDIDAVRSSASLTNMGVAREDQGGTPAQHQQGDKLLGSLREAGLTKNEITFLLNDNGRAAALMNVPAFKVEMEDVMNHLPDYVVVLDRRKLIVDETIYKDDGISPLHKREL
jgi:hypothetical protein